MTRIALTTSCARRTDIVPARAERLEDLLDGASRYGATLLAIEAWPDTVVRFGVGDQGMRGCVSMRSSDFETIVGEALARGMGVAVHICGPVEDRFLDVLRAAPPGRLSTLLDAVGPTAWDPDLRREQEALMALLGCRLGLSLTVDGSGRDLLFALDDIERFGLRPEIHLAPACRARVHAGRT